MKHCFPKVLFYEISGMLFVGGGGSPGVRSGWLAGTSWFSCGNHARNQTVPQPLPPPPLSEGVGGGYSEIFIFVLFASQLTVK
jgi:hypothetical protein